MGATTVYSDAGPESGNIWLLLMDRNGPTVLRSRNMWGNQAPLVGPVSINKCPSDIRLEITGDCPTDEDNLQL